MKRRITKEQIIGFFEQAESGVAVKDLCRKHGFSDATFYKWGRRSRHPGTLRNPRARSRCPTPRAAARHPRGPGPKFTGKAIDPLAYERSVERQRIEAGKPTQNAYVESFNGKFRDECLNEH